MEKPHQCANSNGYSSPVPIIGLYIAGASLVCLMLMLCDVYFAIRRKARYIPCRLFSFNSFTLTLLAIAAKLPVDLTTDMPSARDQLSKLMGTAMICICIGFMAPSLANNKKWEGIANVASIALFVVTVIVNMCIEMRTGVIFSFVPEHIIIMCFMFMLLYTLLHNIVNDYYQEKISRRRLEKFDRTVQVPEGEDSWIFRVKCWYISCCITNPQLVICRESPFSTAVGPICIMCSLVVLQAIYRSIVAQTIEFCEGVSDYRWSMWIIVITQTVTIIIGALVIAFRWLVLFHYFSRKFLLYEALGVMGYVMEDCPCASQTPRPTGIKSKLVSLRMKVMGCMKLLYWLVVVMLEIVICLPMLAMKFFVSKIPSVRCCMHRAKEDIMSSFPWVEQYHRVEMTSEDDELVRRVMMVCLDNMIEWMNAVKRDPSPCHHTIGMLSRLDPSTTPQQLLERFPPSHDDDKEITCLSMVVLVKVVAASVPDQSIPIIKSMIDTLHEAFEIVYFASSEKRQLARRLWKNQDFDMSIKVLSEDPNDPNDPVGCVISKIERADEILFPDDWDATIESRRVRDFIRKSSYATIEELCGDVQQLFSAMLHHLFAQLPICVYREVRQGSVYERDERARYLTKLLLCNLDPILVDKVQWEFPDGWPANTSRNFDVPPDSHDTNAQLDGSTEGGARTSHEIGLSAGEIRLAIASDNV
ncbi:hypothetical protein Sjap_012185 [Stephania japonica]|uniref:Uncharacterized protein n=1 Tax=Stephania japonica TaxID=461633 RepID=A0AAP0IX89_9MAGN